METNMNSNILDGTNVALLQTGSFMAQQFQQARNLPPDAPCLTAVLTRDQFTAVEKNRDGLSCFGLGSVPALNDDVMTMRFQLGAAQFYWLADMTDPELWEVVDVWLKLGRVPVGLACFEGKQDKYMFLQPEWRIENPTVNKFRGKQTLLADARVWDNISGLAKSRQLERYATSDIPGVVLRKVVVNVLMTDRLTKEALIASLKGLQIPGGILKAI